MRKAVCVLVVMCVLLAGCSEKTKYTETVHGLFDTVCTFTAYSGSESLFETAADEVTATLTRLDMLFDCYDEYEGLRNVAYVNSCAHEAPVLIDDELFAVLSDMKQRYAADGRVNIAMGTVIGLWHDWMADDEYLAPPAYEKLLEVSRHTDFNDVILDVEASTVYFADPELKLDLGSVGKGYAARAAAETASKYLPSFLINLGGNVVCRGDVDWKIGVADPDSENNLEVLKIRDKSIVTSGDYKRFRMYEGERYHHIIDPETLYPGTAMRAVTVVCDDPAEADYLSTSLFLAGPDEALAYAEMTEGLDVLIVQNDGTVIMTEGMRGYIAR